MSYYDSIDDDITRAKEILAEGKLTIADLDETPAEIRDQLIALSGTITVANTYAAYKLLESFVAEIARLRTEIDHRHMALQRIMQVLGPDVPEGIDYTDPINAAGLTAEVHLALDILKAAGITYQQRKGTRP